MTPFARSFISIYPLSSPRGPTTICQGNPIKSMGREFCPWALVAVVIEYVDAVRAGQRVDTFAGLVATLIADLEIDQPELEGCNLLGPDDPLVVVTRFNDRADQPVKPPIP